jgi:hypothetical protein
MRLRYQRLLDPTPNPGGGGTPPPAADWRASLPDDIKADPTLAAIQDVPSLAKSYVHAQRTIGHQRLIAPQKNWTEKEWGELFGQLGRPEKPEGYVTPTDIKFEEGLGFDDAKLAKARDVFHKAGLLPTQADAILKYYAESLNDSVKADRMSREGSKAAAETELKAELGEKYGPAVELANGVVRNFAPEGFVDFLKEHKLDNHPMMIKMMYKIGSVISEDTARGSKDLIPLTNASQAKNEINKAIADPEFLTALRNRRHPGHKDAVARWENLHKTAGS